MDIHDLMNFRVQTRSEETGVQQHSDFQSALDAAYQDQTIWKISFELMTGERIRLVKIPQGWVYSPITD